MALPHFIPAPLASLEKALGPLMQLERGEREGAPDPSRDRVAVSAAARRCSWRSRPSLPTGKSLKFT